MPSRKELVAHDKDDAEIASAIGADLVIFQTLPDLVNSVRQLNTNISTFDCSVFTGEYVTGGVDEEYLAHLEDLRADNIRTKLNLNMSALDKAGPERVGVNGNSGAMKDASFATESSTPINGSDDTVGLHNTWNTHS
jgi:amidophosphoribosyltransferase